MSPFSSFLLLLALLGHTLAATEVYKPHNDDDDDDGHKLVPNINITCPKRACPNVKTGACICGPGARKSHVPPALDKLAIEYDTAEAGLDAWYRASLGFEPFYDRPLFAVDTLEDSPYDQLFTEFRTKMLPFAHKLNPWDRISLEHMFPSEDRFIDWRHCEKPQLCADYDRMRLRLIPSVFDYMRYEATTFLDGTLGEGLVENYFEKLPVYNNRMVRVWIGYMEAAVDNLNEMRAVDFYGSLLAYAQQNQFVIRRRRRNEVAFRVCDAIDASGGTPAGEACVGGASVAAESDRASSFSPRSDEDANGYRGVSDLVRHSSNAKIVAATAWAFAPSGGPSIQATPQSNGDCATTYACDVILRASEVGYDIPASLRAELDAVIAKFLEALLLFETYYDSALPISSTLNGSEDAVRNASNTLECAHQDLVCTIAPDAEPMFNRLMQRMVDFKAVSQSIFDRDIDDFLGYTGIGAHVFAPGPFGVTNFRYTAEECDGTNRSVGYTETKLYAELVRNTIHGRGSLFREQTGTDTFIDPDQNCFGDPFIFTHRGDFPNKNGYYANNMGIFSRWDGLTVIQHEIVHQHNVGRSREIPDGFRRRVRSLRNLRLVGTEAVEGIANYYEIEPADNEQNLFWANTLTYAASRYVQNEFLTLDAVTKLGIDAGLATAQELAQFRFDTSIFGIFSSVEDELASVNTIHNRQTDSFASYSIGAERYRDLRARIIQHCGSGPQDNWPERALWDIAQSLPGYSLEALGTAVDAYVEAGCDFCKVRELEASPGELCKEPKCH